jgi:hypothetical protein
LRNTDIRPRSMSSRLARAESQPRKPDNSGKPTVAELENVPSANQILPLFRTAQGTCRGAPQTRGSRKWAEVVGLDPRVR